MARAFTNMRSLNGIMMGALNLFDPGMKQHHDQMAYLASMIANDLGFDPLTQHLTMFGAMTHDIGRVMMKKQDSTAGAEEDAKAIAQMGAIFTSKFVHSDLLPDIIARSQTSWTEYLELPDEERELCNQVARIASIVHLVDMVSTTMQADEPILKQAETMRSSAERLRGTEYSEEAVDAFLRVTANESVWMDFKYHPERLEQYSSELIRIPLNVAVALTKDTSLIVDYRSAFTATHSAGVAASATALARYAGMSSDECQMMRIAGNLHDIGKLRVPRAILEKPGRLTEEEFCIIKEHPYFTHLILRKADGFDRIASWAGFHHEKLNGTGYPFRYGKEMLDTGARIMAVADIFAAIAEVRPYRAGMKREQALGILNDSAKNGEIDSDLVALLSEHYEDIDSLRETAAQVEGARYFEPTTQEEADRLRETAARAESAGYEGFVTKEEIESLRIEARTSYEGALDVERGQFAKQYVYISNLEKRFSHPFKLLLISLDVAEGKSPHAGELEKSMFHMEESIRQAIRNVDVMTRYDSQQFFVILVGTDLQGAKTAVDRVFRSYYDMNGGKAYTPSYCVVDMN